MLITTVGENSFFLADDEKCQEEEEKEISVKTKVKQIDDSGQSVGRYGQI